MLGLPTSVPTGLTLVTNFYSAVTPQDGDMRYLNSRRGFVTSVEYSYPKSWANYITSEKACLGDAGASGNSHGLTEGVIR
jgi:hypothetical protein